MDLDLKDASDFFARTAASIRALPDVELVALAMRAQSPTAALREEIAARAVAGPTAKAKRTRKARPPVDEEVAKGAPRPSRPADRGTLGSRIVSALREQPLTQASLASLLKAKRTVVSATLNKLRAAGQVVRPEIRRGKWRAA